MLWGALINYLFPRGDKLILIKWWKKATCWVSIITRNERPQGFEESSSTVAADSSNGKCAFCFGYFLLKSCQLLLGGTRKAVKDLL